jgi:hypothetical protein
LVARQRDQALGKRKVAEKVGLDDGTDKDPLHCKSFCTLELRQGDRVFVATLIS